MRKNDLTFGVYELLDLYLLISKINNEVTELINKSKDEILNNEIVQYKLKKYLADFKNINYSDLFDKIKNTTIKEKVDFHPNFINLLLKIGKIWSDYLNVNKNKINDLKEFSQNIEVNTLNYIYEPIDITKNKERYVLKYSKKENGDFLDGEIRKVAILCEEKSFTTFDPNDWKNDENPTYELKRSTTLRLNKNNIDDIILIFLSNKLNEMDLYNLNKAKFDKNLIKKLDYDIKIKKIDNFLEARKKKQTISDFIDHIFWGDIIFDYSENDFGYFELNTREESLDIISKDDEFFVYIPKSR